MPYSEHIRTHAEARRREEKEMNAEPLTASNYDWSWYHRSAGAPALGLSFWQEP